MRPREDALPTLNLGVSPGSRMARQVPWNFMQRLAAVVPEASSRQGLSRRLAGVQGAVPPAYTLPKTLLDQIETADGP
jgi:hypothetical protein